jgi:hypothetical protein
MTFSPYLLLPFDSIFLLLGFSGGFSQVFPAVLVYSGLILFAALFFPKSFRRVDLLEYILLFFILGYLLLVTWAPFFFNDDKNIAWSSFLRQFMALLGGLAIYLSFRIFDVSSIVIARHIKIALITTIPIIFLQIFGSAGDPFRVQGYSTEPSHFGHFLSFAAIPWMLIAGLSSSSNKILFVYLNVCLLLTVSITAYFSAFLVYMLWTINNFNIIKFHHVVVTLVFCSLFLLFVDIEFSYAYRNASFFLSFDNFNAGMLSSASLTDRFYSFWAPIGGLIDSKITFGGGIGGDYLILPEIVPSEALELISSVRSGDVGLASFFGKVVTWGGWVLAWLYVVIFFIFYKNADQNIRYFALPVFISSLFSMGSLVVPYVWMWFAILRNSKKT